MSDRPDDDAFARDVAAHYAPPPMTSSQRARFDARLEERLRRDGWRSRPWLTAGALAASAAALLLWRTASVQPAPSDLAATGAGAAVVETAATPEEWILAVGTEPVSSSDDGLPADYVAISDLLLAGE